MKITSLEEYGLRCVLTLAMETRKGPLTVGEIAAREGLSVPHVAKLMTVLREAGLVESVRGRSGGYVLSRTPASISVEEVLGALGEPLFTSAYCEGHPGTLDVCAHHGGCSIRSVWQVIGEMVHGALRNISLADLCAQEARIAEALMEHAPSGLLAISGSALVPSGTAACGLPTETK